MTKYIITFLLLLSGKATFAQSPKPPIKQKVIMEISPTDKREMLWEYNWTGWNWVENKDTYRPHNGHDTLLIYNGWNEKGIDMYELVPRLGALGSPVDIYRMQEAKLVLIRNLQLFSPSPEFNEVQCKLKLLTTYDLQYCDKDKYPYPRSLDEGVISREINLLAPKKATEIRGIAACLGLQEGATPNYEEKFLLYDYLKKMKEIILEKDGKSYNFSMLTTTTEENVLKSYQLVGKIDPTGKISEVKKTEKPFIECRKK